MVCILLHSISFGLDFGSFYLLGFAFRVTLFFRVVEICDRTGILVKEMFVYPSPPPGT